MEIVIKVIFIVAMVLSCILICILNAHKEEIWEAIYKKLWIKENND